MQFEFCRAFASACFPSEVIQDCPRAPTLSLDRLELPGGLRYKSQSPESVRGGHTCFDLLLSNRDQCDLETFRGTGKVNSTHGCSQLLMFFVCELMK